MLIPTSRATPRNTAVMVRIVRARRFGRLREAIFAESNGIYSTVLIRLGERASVFRRQRFYCPDSMLLPRKSLADLLSTSPVPHLQETLRLLTHDGIVSFHL